MAGRIIFLLEEPSMKDLLTRLIPRTIPGMVEHENFLCIPHQGKTDLERSIPRKLKGWKEPGVRFIVVEDNDSRICTEIKNRLKSIALEAGHPSAVVRLVCQELESWYLGDLKALAEAFDREGLDTDAHRKRYADPDTWQKPSAEVERLIPGFQKRSGARLMGDRLGIHANFSVSFNVFISGMKRVASELGYSPT